MILYKTLDEKEVLEAVAYLVSMSLPEHIKNTDYEIHATFTDDNCVDVHITQSDNEQVLS